MNWLDKIIKKWYKECNSIDNIVDYFEWCKKPFIIPETNNNKNVKIKCKDK